jgi:hypothetical protein
MSRPKRLDWVDSRRFPCRVNSKQNPNANGQKNRSHEWLPNQNLGQLLHSRGQLYSAPANPDARNSARKRNERRFEQELRDNIASGRSDRTPDANFLASL